MENLSVSKRGVNKRPKYFPDTSLYRKIPKSVFADIAYNFALLMTGSEDRDEAIRLILKERELVKHSK